MSRKLLFVLVVSFSSFLLSCQKQNEDVPVYQSKGVGGNKKHAISVDAVSITTENSLKQVSIDSNSLEFIVKAVLDSVYGRNKFDSSRGCWHHSFQTGGDSIEYCMIAAKPEAINADGGIMIYLQAYSDPQAEIYSQVEPGLEGLFLIEVGAGKKWRVVASNPAIDRGQAGDCGCLDSKLIEVGPSRYGWLSTMGGVWQGIQATHYSLQVPIGSKIRDVSNIPRVRENSPGESNTLEVERNGEVVAGMYPLKVTLSRGDSVLETRLVAYDEKQGFYPWKP